MFVLTLMSFWMCTRELLRPSAILRWIETSDRNELPRRGLALACGNFPSFIFRASVEQASHIKSSASGLFVRI